MDPAIFDPELTELADRLFVNLHFRRLLTEFVQKTIGDELRYGSHSSLQKAVENTVRERLRNQT
jgi:hypothetical protein